MVGWYNVPDSACLPARVTVWRQATCAWGLMQRRTIIVQGPLAFRMRRLEAAHHAEAGLQIMTLPQLAARLAGGFVRPATPQELAPAIQTAIEHGEFNELGKMVLLPGLRRALLATLGKIWDADLDLQSLATTSA